MKKLNVDTSLPPKEKKNYWRSKVSPSNKEDIKKKDRIRSYSSDVYVTPRSKEFYDEHFPRDETKQRISLFEPTKSFQRFGGIGIVFFFNMFRTLISFYLAASTAYSVPLIVSFVSNHNNTISPESATIISIENQENPEIMFGMSVSRTVYVVFLSFMDLIAISFFVAFVSDMRAKEKIILKSEGRDSISVSNFSVLIRHLPTHTNLVTLREELIDHFETKLNDRNLERQHTQQQQQQQHITDEELNSELMLVADINFGLVRSDKIERILRERGHLVREMDRIWQSEETQKKKLKRLREKIRVCDAKINSLEDRLRAESAIVTFNSELAYLRAMALFSKRQKYQPSALRFVRDDDEEVEEEIYVERAPHPSDVQWENMGFSERNRTIRKIGVFLLTIILLFLSFSFVSFCRSGTSSHDEEGDEDEKSSFVL